MLLNFFTIYCWNMYFKTSTATCHFHFLTYLPPTIYYLISTTYHFLPTTLQEQSTTFIYDLINAFDHPHPLFFSCHPLIIKLPPTSLTWDNPPLPYCCLSKGVYCPHPWPAKCFPYYSTCISSLEVCWWFTTHIHDLTSSSLKKYKIKKRTTTNKTIENHWLSSIW